MTNLIHKIHEVLNLVKGFEVGYDSKTAKDGKYLVEYCGERYFVKMEKLKIRPQTFLMILTDLNILIDIRKKMGEMKLKPDWQKENNTCCYFCGTTRSVKYEIDLLNVYGDRVLTVDACNKCALLNDHPTEKGGVE